MDGYTGNIILLGVDECGDDFHIKTYTLHGDLETPAELQAWQEAKIAQASENYPEASGFVWVDQLSNKQLEEQELEEKYQRFITEIFPSLVADGVYPSDWDPDDAYVEYQHENY